MIMETTNKKPSPLVTPPSEVDGHLSRFISEWKAIDASPSVISLV